ncbi:hypothetical protein U9M48_002182 [Paspalum notatum var. saurae]|uniref:Uncharacterized protein n=1 Tax=Paspalum notatum var. saurae TaxID=547442 RepID=A0AAQ3SFT1_PASNO
MARERRQRWRPYIEELPRREARHLQSGRLANNCCTGAHLRTGTTPDMRRVPGKDATDGSPRRREDKTPPRSHTEAHRRPSASIASRAIGHLHLPGEGVRPPLLPSADAARQRSSRRACRGARRGRHHDRWRVSTDGGGAMRAHRDTVNMHGELLAREPVTPERAAFVLPLCMAMQAHVQVHLPERPATLRRWPSNYPNFVQRRSTSPMMMLLPGRVRSSPAAPTCMLIYCYHYIYYASFDTDEADDAGLHQLMDTDEAIDDANTPTSTPTSSCARRSKAKIEHDDHTTTAV